MRVVKQLVRKASASRLQPVATVPALTVLPVPESSGNSSLPVDLVKKIIAEGLQASYRQLHITGGEPLLWEGLFDVLEFAFDSRLRTRFAEYQRHAAYRGGC